MSEVFSQGNYLTDWLKGELEQPDRFTRDSIIVLAGEDLVSGSVLGKITASGKYVAWDPDASDGSQTVRGILVTPVMGDTSADQPASAITRGPAEVIQSKLSFKDTTDGSDQTVAMAALATLGIIARQPA